jgi:DNA-binding transcriptional LysR family regulator
VRSGTDLNLIVALRALLEEGNVTRAGARIGMSQPAMSAALARLRRHFDDDLLVRVGRDYELTPLAKELLPRVQSAVHEVVQALRVAEEFDPSTSERRFVISVSDYALTVIHEPLRTRVAREAPHVELEFVELDADLPESDRAFRLYDFVIGPLGYGFQGQAEAMFDDSMVVVLDRDNPAGAKGYLTLADLEDAPHAVSAFKGNPQTPADRAFGELQLTRQELVRTNGYLPLPFVVVGSQALALIPSRLARRFAKAPRMRFLPLPEGVEVPLHEAMWWHPSHEADPAHRWMIGILRSIGEDLRKVSISL